MRERQRRHLLRMSIDKRFVHGAALLLTLGIATSLGLASSANAQSDVKRVGVLNFMSPSEDPTWNRWMNQFSKNLAERGWIEGKNFLFETRSVSGDPSRYAQAAAELARLNVELIYCGSAPSLRAAFEATRTIPIVGIDFTTDPIAEGYVRSYAKPGGNVTGVFMDAPEFAGKWFQLLTALVPDMSRVAIVWDPGPGNTHLKAALGAARFLNIEAEVFEVHSPGDIDKAFKSIGGQHQAVMFLPSPMIYTQSAKLAKLALEHNLPATSMSRQFADAGGALAYGPELTSTFDRIAFLVASILDGNKPAALPVERPSEIRLVVNLKTAKTLGLTIPPPILLRVDEVIR